MGCTHLASDLPNKQISSYLPLPPSSVGEGALASHAAVLPSFHTFPQHTVELRHQHLPECFGLVQLLVWLSSVEWTVMPSRTGIHSTNVYFAPAVCLPLLLVLGIHSYPQDE